MVMYILALALQVAGAVILIIKYLGKTKDRIKSEYFPGAGIANNDGNDNAIINLIDVRKCVKRIYANRAAFIYIALGYATSIFGDKSDCNNWCLLVYVATETIILIFLKMVIAHILTHIFYKEDMLVPYKELPIWIAGTTSENDIKGLFEK